MAQTSQIPRPAPGRPGARAFAVVVWLAAASAAVSCGSPAPSSGRPITRQVIPITGGQASTPNGKFKIQIPRDALTKDLPITIQQIDPLGPGAIGPVYDVGPTATQFMRPVTLAFSFAGLDLGGAPAATLKVATFSGGKWVPVTSAVDHMGSIVTGQITHLSPWTLISYTDEIPPEPDASTPDDMDGGAGTSGGGGSAGGGASGADGGSKDGAAGAGGSGGAGGKAGAGGAAGSTGGAGGKAGAGGAAGSMGGTGGSAGAAGSGQGGAGGQGGAAGTSGQGGSTAGASGQSGGAGGAAGQGADASAPPDDAADPDAT